MKDSLFTTPPAFSPVEPVVPYPAAFGQPIMTPTLPQEKEEVDNTPLQPVIPLSAEEMRILLPTLSLKQIKHQIRHITKLHLEGNLTPDWLDVFLEIKEKFPDLLFWLSPTTICNETGQNISSIFAIDPTIIDLNRRNFEMKIQAKPLVKQPESNSSHVSLELVNLAVAKERICPVIQYLGEDFPWFHPETPGTGVVLAGALPAAVFLPEDKAMAILENTDIDLFIYGPDPIARKEMHIIVQKWFQKFYPKDTPQHFKSVWRLPPRNSFIDISKNHPEIQVICSNSLSPFGVIANFDATHVQVGMWMEKGETKFVTTPGWLYFTPRSESFIVRNNLRIHRLIKMMRRGFKPVSFGMHMIHPMKEICDVARPWDIYESEGQSGSYDVNYASLTCAAPAIPWRPGSYEGIQQSFDPSEDGLLNGFDVYTSFVDQVFDVEETACGVLFNTKVLNLDQRAMSGILILKDVLDRKRGKLSDPHLKYEEPPGIPQVPGSQVERIQEMESHDVIRVLFRGDFNEAHLFDIDGSYMDQSALANPEYRWNCMFTNFNSYFTSSGSVERDLKKFVNITRFYLHR